MDSTKPPYTYTELIVQALKENREMTVSAILQMDSVSFFFCVFPVRMFVGTF